MQTSLKIPTNPVEVNNDGSTVTLRIDKKRLAHLFRKMVFALVFMTLMGLLVITYTSGNPQFWPLLKASAILSMIGFIAFKSNSTFKKQ